MSTMTLIASSSAVSSSSGTTLDTAATFTIAAGDILVAVGRWDGTAATPSIADAAGGNALTMLTTRLYGTTTKGQIALGYKIASTAATQKVRFTLSNASASRDVVVFQLRPDGTKTTSIDVSGADSEADTLTPTTQNFNTAGSADELVFCAAGCIFQKTWTVEQINGAAATGVLHSEAGTCFTSAWYSLITDGAKTGIHGNATINTSNYSGIDVIAIKSVAAAGGLSIPVALRINEKYRQLPKSRWVNKNGVLRRR